MENGIRQSIKKYKDKQIQTAFINQLQHNQLIHFALEIYTAKRLKFKLKYNQDQNFYNLNFYLINQMQRIFKEKLAGYKIKNKNYLKV